MSCSFCNKPGVLFGDGVRICDPCVGLCAEILAERVGTPAAPNVPGSQLAPAWIDAVIARLDERPILEDVRCSFCGADGDLARAIIAGPRVYICEACVAAAVRHLAR